uniref:Uncharacterized protein n=1 Tax=Arundo donax TaxID=35708 RepID=A0A0A9ACF7_ARUDO
MDWVRRRTNRIGRAVI